MLKKILFYLDLVWSGFVTYNLSLIKRDLPPICTIKRTMDKINDLDKSIARYGDGEFNMILGSGNGFQDYDPNLASKLLDILKSDPDGNCLIALPGFENSSMKLRARMYWRSIFPQYRVLLNNTCRYNEYYNSFITRPYMDFNNIMQTQYVFDTFDEIFMGRNILVVEGEGTQLGVGNNLLSNAKSVKRVLCPNKNAFRYYDEIHESIKSNSEKEDLILIALGPTATVLCWELSQIGYKCIDIGHLDVELFWKECKSNKKIPVPGKNVNELGIIGVKSNLSDEYENSIIQRVALNE
jgi:glycosyltransferase family protein